MLKRSIMQHKKKLWDFDKETLKNHENHVYVILKGTFTFQVNFFSLSYTNMPDIF